MAKSDLRDNFNAIAVTIREDIARNPQTFALAGKWLDENYWDEDKVWRAIERRSSKLLEKSFQREDRQESPSFVRPDSDVDICKVLQAVAVVDMGFWPDLEHLLARYKEAANAIPHNFRTITERTSTRGKIVKFLDELLPFYREHQAGLVCRWHGLYIACEDLIEKHEQIGVLNELDNKRVCLLTWLTGCPDLGNTKSPFTKFQALLWVCVSGEDHSPHRAKALKTLELNGSLSKWTHLLKNVFGDTALFSGDKIDSDSGPKHPYNGSNDVASDKSKKAELQAQLNKILPQNRTAPTTLKRLAELWGGDMTPKKLKGLIKSGRITAAEMNRQTYVFDTTFLPESVVKTIKN